MPGICTPFLNDGVCVYLLLSFCGVQADYTRGVDDLLPADRAQQPHLGRVGAAVLHHLAGWAGAWAGPAGVVADHVFWAVPQVLGPSVLAGSAFSQVVVMTCAVFEVTTVPWWMAPASQVTTRSLTLCSLRSAAAAAPVLHWWPPLVTFVRPVSPYLAQVAWGLGCPGGVQGASYV